MLIIAAIWLTTMITWYHGGAQWFKEKYFRGWFLEFTSCPMCLGFWIGAISCALLRHSLTESLVCGLVVSGLSMMLFDAYNEARLVWVYALLAFMLGLSINEFFNTNSLIQWLIK